MRVLVIEDEDDLRLTLAKSLSEAGYAVDLAADGAEGLFKAENCEYDAILLDVMLPRMDGWEVLERVRRTKKTPVLMLTARDSREDRIRGLDLGSDDYAVKPFDLEELQARLRALIRRSAGHASSILRAGPIVIDSARKLVSVEGVSVGLTPIEFALLEYLAMRLGLVVSRAELYDHLFSEDDDSLSNLLDVHVCNLRNKLGRDLIQTRRGLGYVFETP